VKHVGVCGSDIHYFATGRIGDQVVRYPFILGHEGCGVVAEAAELAAGTPVYIEPAIACHECDQCRAGRENTCRSLRFLGNPLEMGGCMCDEIAMPAECLAPLPDWVRPGEGALLEPLCIGVYAVERSGVAPGAKAAIVGAGPIGLSVLLALSDRSLSQIVVSEPVPARRRASMALGASECLEPGPGGAAQSVFDAAMGGVDVAFECAGSQESIDDASGMLKPGGTLVVIGIPEGKDRILYDPHLMRRREVTVVHVRRQNRALPRAMAILERRRDAFGIMVTHRFDPSRAQEAFELVERRSDGVIKALLEF
jgi:L-iditol 2-dehydrogenase